MMFEKREKDSMFNLNMQNLKLSALFVIQVEQQVYQKEL